MDYKVEGERSRGRPKKTWQWGYRKRHQTNMQQRCHEQQKMEIV